MHRTQRNWDDASPTVDTNVYASGDLIGGKLTFSKVMANIESSGVLREVHVYDKAKQAVTLTLILFSSDPTGTTFTDQAAFDVADADLDKIVAIVPLSTHLSLNDNSVTYATGLAIPVRSTDVTDRDTRRTLYGALMSGGTPTYAAATDVKVRLAIEQD